MEEELEVILRAVDDASSTFESVADSASEMGESIENVASDGNAGLGNLQESAEEAASGLGDVQESAEDAGYSMEQLIDYCQNMYAGKIEEVANETERAREESDEAGDSFLNLSNILSGIAGAEIFSKLADTLWDFADKAGSFEDSMMRARLEAEGAGISVNEMTDTVSELSRVTGRAGGEIRESFIKATARGITDMDSFKKMMVGAGAQATLLGTDIQSMGDKFSSMAMRSTLMERQLASTGITMEELASAMGMTGATADEVKAKWEELDTNQRAAALGMAASMNEGQTANEEYKKSWAGLQAQLDIARGRLERLAGEVLLPVLIPALQAAGRMLNWVGDVVSALMKGPLGGLISIVGSVAAGFALVVPALMAVKGAMALYTASLAPAITATWALISPWLPFIAIGAAIVAIIYEIGKAFGWWTDVGSMMDAIWAGVQRLWSAFINHPDVQGFLSALTDAWNWLVPAVSGVVNAVLKFFGVSSSSNFDIVQMWIDNVSMAWKAMTAPIRLVISVIQQLWNAFQLMYTKCKEALDNAKKAFDNFKAKVKQIIDDVKKKVKSITNIDISGVINKIVQPFKDAYEGVKKQVEKIKEKAKEIPSNVGRGGLGILGGAFGFDYEGMLEELNKSKSANAYSTSGNESLSLDHNINFSFDFTNLPEGTSEETLVAMLRSAITDRSVINSLVNSPDFQSLDGKVKDRLMLKNNRARGV